MDGGKGGWRCAADTKYSLGTSSAYGGVPFRTKKFSAAPAAGRQTFPSCLDLELLTSGLRSQRIS